ncbi:ISAs1 family transposase [Methylomonas fluvii]|uniref:ISAs1 family transposase n=1 Tax=Methylomonas fluvii TaxID=1854564 RepID=A0ABR9D8L7_9GAMM|nr:ISAs1 family transposase [Methylomonas fluvii]MBD9359444.1 ISAs1 family transposase [Methylomonas fluvii]
MSLPSASILQHFANLADPRINRQKKHQLQDIFFITLCAVICGADNWVEIEEYGCAKEDWFTEQLGLTNGIPSHDTFGAVFAAIDPTQFSECFSRWVADLAALTEGEIIAIDGKCLRRSIDSSSKKAAIHLVSAWAQQNRLVLGQVKVDDKSNEITAIPKLLERLDIAGAVITIDAMGCQKKIAEQIVRQGGNYVLSLKGNQGSLLDDVETFFTSALAPDAVAVGVDGEHGRLETRTIAATDDIGWLRERHDWPGLNSILAVTLRQESGQTIREDTRYFISSLKADDHRHLANAVRAHWSIENNLHWVLDVAFDEDRNRTRQGHSAANLAVIRHIALNLLKNETSRKVGIKVKRKRAGWDNDYLLRLIRGI